MGFAMKLLGRVRSGLGLLFPVFARVGDFRHWGRVAYGVAHVLLLVAILVGLAFLNRSLRLEELVVGPSRALRDLWLPLLFFLFYLICWVGWWLWKLLGPEAIRNEFPDIERAWSEALQALDTARIDWRETPLFLVLGRPVSPVSALFEASRMKFSVEQAPARSDSPLHVYANREAIYLICPGVSLVAQHAATLALNEPAREAEADRYANRIPPDEVALCTLRLEYLSKLIVRERSPYCAANGVLVVVPAEGLFRAEAAEELSFLVRREIATARAGLRVHCPLLFLVGDLERVAGCREFLAQLSPEAKDAPVGLPYPLVPDLEPSKVMASISEAIVATHDALLNPLVYGAFGFAESPPRPAEEVTRDNAELYRFLSRLRRALPRLELIVRRAVPVEADAPPLYGGCYFAATGQDAAREQAFVAPVFRAAIDQQNFVFWTREALDAEESYRRWTSIGLVVSLLCLGTIVSMLYWL